MIQFAAFIILTAHTLSQADDDTSSSGRLLNETELRMVLSDACIQVDNYLKAERFQVNVPAPALCSFSFSTNLDYKQTVGVFQQTPKAELNAEVLTNSGKIITFINGRAFQAAYGPSAVLQLKPPPAQWAEGHAIEIASKFANIFVKPWGAKLGKPYFVNFDWTCVAFDKKLNALKSGPGEWTIKWRRETATGIPFGTDGVEVHSSEKYGPYLIKIYFRADYNGEDDHVTPIAKDKALIEARKGLERILAGQVGKGTVPGGQPAGTPEMALYIVCPNDLLNEKSITEAAFSGEGKGRLAWVATYKVSVPSDPNVSAHVSVYIDAKDGSFLGGTL